MVTGLLFLAGIIFVGLGIFNLIKRKSVVKENPDVRAEIKPSLPASTVTGVREQDAIYQKGKLVARVLEPEIDADAREIRFEEIYNSDYLVIPDECEFQKYRIVIQRIAYATKVDRQLGHKGRILRGCVADILGYREQ